MKAKILRETFKTLDDFFGDPEKTNLWLETENPLLGGFEPYVLIRLGKEERLLKIIKEAIDENTLK